MTYFRPQSIEHIHNKLSAFTFSLTPTRQVSSLLTYLRTYGIVHSLISGQSIKARDHMYQLEFFIEYINAQQFSTTVLKTCRVLDINEETPSWNRLISSIEEPVHEHQVLLMDFCNFANWFGSAEKIARWILDHSEVNSDIWQQSILGLSDTLRDLGRHDEAILELEQLNNISTSFETMMRIQSSLSVIYLHQNNLEMVKNTLIPYLDFCRNFGTLKDQANALHNIGSMYRKLGDYLLSKEAYEEAIAIRNQELGRNHIQTLMSQQSLAIVLKNIEQFDQAKSIFEDVLQIVLLNLGETHIRSIIVMNNLSLVLRDSNNLSEALSICQKSHLAAIKCLGKEHHTTLVIQTNLAIVLKRMGQYQLAVDALRQILSLQNSHLGLEHQDTLITTYKLATTLTFLKGEHSNEITVLLKFVFDKRETHLGSDHPSTIVAGDSLRTHLYDIGNYDESIQIHLKVLQCQIERHGSKHIIVANSRYELANTYLEINQGLEAIHHLAQTLDIEIQEYGDQCEDIAMTYWNLARGYRQSKKPLEASQYRTLCWKLEIQKLGRLDSEVLKTAIALIKDWIEASLFLEASTLRTQLIEEFQFVENPSAEQTKQFQRLQTTIVPSSDI